MVMMMFIVGQELVSLITFLSQVKCLYQYQSYSAKKFFCHLPLGIIYFVLNRKHNTGELCGFTEAKLSE